MKTFPQVLDWVGGATETYGDPSEPICQLFFRWENDLKAYRGDELVCGIHEGQLVLYLGAAFPTMEVHIDADGAQLDENGGLKAFGAERIARSLWALDPSLNAVGLIHGFVVLYGVPQPAPWERLIVLPGEA